MSVPNVFTPRTVILSALVNQDFAYLDANKLSYDAITGVNPGMSTSILKDNLNSFCIGPGAGEFVYDTVPIAYSTGGYENYHTIYGKTDFSVAMDNMQKEFPSVDHVYAVVSWFGDDLRAGFCTIRPKVDNPDKVTIPYVWSVNGVFREDAQVVSFYDGKPAYGGTPSDNSVVRMCVDYFNRGIAVGLYIFQSMDIPIGNDLPNPNGTIGQPPYPWRGEIEVLDTSQLTPDATTEIEHFFGNVQASDISISIDPETYEVTTVYTGSSEDWGLRRQVLHYAKLTQAINNLIPGTCTELILSSELRALFQSRSSQFTCPAVPLMQVLLADVKSLVGSDVRITYAFDHSDWNGFSPKDGSGDWINHGDAIYADPNCDFIGIDWYEPISDWRDGTNFLDYQAGWRYIYDPNYLYQYVNGGENKDWYYASYEARVNQIRTPITDGANHKPWVYEAKNVPDWWENQHYNRIAGHEFGSPTAWVPKSKTIEYTELGFGSVDKATNEPSKFFDPKSSEGGYPYFSNGNPDILIEQRGLEATYSYWANNNKTSPLFNGNMISRFSVWNYDARPYPTYPLRTDVWGDTDEYPNAQTVDGKISFEVEHLDTAAQDALIAFGCAQLIVISRFIPSPPVNPKELATYIIPETFDPTWQYFKDYIVFFHGGVAYYIKPRPNTRAYIQGEDINVIYTGTEWVEGLVGTEGGGGFSIKTLELDVELIGDSVTTDLIIPNRAIVCSVATRVIETIAGATSYEIGVEGDLSKFGSTLGINLNDSNIGVIGPTAYYDDTNIVITAQGGSFTNGVVRLILYYMQFNAPSGV